MTAAADAITAKRLRDELVDRLVGQGAVRSERVERALRAVPRHLFVPTVSLEEAYSDDPVYTKRDASGVSISAASQPAIVAMMLEQLEVEPGDRVLEIGAGTGYNAALLVHLVGDRGHVTTIDVDEDIVEGARANLATAGAANVHVVLGDGALGYADDSPYDRVIATVGAADLPSTWSEQLAPGGRLVVPLRLRGSVSRSIVFEQRNGHWVSRSSEMCAFMPLRGIADDARSFVALTSDGTVTLQTNREQLVDSAALADVLEGDGGAAVWTGVVFGAAESFEWLDLWLTCTMDNALSRMPVQPAAVEHGLVRPQFGWGAMAVVDGADLAYLTLRPAGQNVSHDSDGAAMYEVGVIGHGPCGGRLAGQVSDAVRAWDLGYRSRTVRIEVQDRGSAEQITGQFNFSTTGNRLAISWG